MRLVRSAFLLLAALAILPACDSTEEFSIGGTYTGQIVDAPDGASVSVVIPNTESGGTFTFAVTSTQGGFAGAGTGTYDHPSITLTVEDDETSDDFASGTVSDDGRTITLDAGDGLFTLRRQ